MGSIAGRAAPPSSPCSSDSGAVHALARVLAVENPARAVRVNAVLPGIIDTAANRKAMPNADRTGWAAPEALARVTRACPR